jgi:hypothetical protein
MRAGGRRQSENPGSIKLKAGRQEAEAGGIEAGGIRHECISTKKGLQVAKVRT